MDINTLHWLLTLVISSGFVAFLREIVVTVQKLRKGVAAKEGSRNGDLAAQRDESLRGKHEAVDRAQEAERDARLAKARLELLDDYAHALREFCIAHGTRPSDLPPFPRIDS